ncbi:MAG: peptidoglycan DD-metalloendopeptidase family protein, partial [Clostridia bacterium]|nr:peptidoglycan DD-metalloendopeptidase family protein [Clostridia bacterium]
ALTIVIALIIGMLTSIVFSLKTYGASDVSNMQNKLDDLMEKRERLEKELESIKDKKEAALEQKALIDQQIMDLNTEAELLNDIVDTLSSELEESEEALEEAESVLDENTELAKSRIRAMYELGSTSYLNIILGSKSLHDFITRVELVKQMTAYDQQVIDALKETKTTIEEETKAIKEKKDAQQKALDSLESNVASLKKKQSQSSSLIETFNAKTAENIKAIEAAERAEAELQAEIRQALANSSNENFVGGQFLWPIPGYYTITSPFGYRTHPTTGVYKLHTGVDIAGSKISGKPILAANSGKVIKAGYNRGYGNYVVIDHGGGYSTLYGHASSLAVSAGQSVTRGDTIAYVGTTGYSTGYHLHFEIIENGEYKDPLSYFDINFTFA